MNSNIGIEIKQRRKEKNMTLKDVSEKTGLSIGYLSQMERGLTTIAYHTIVKISDALDTDLSDFINEPAHSGKKIVRGYNKKVSSIDNNRYLFYILSERADDCAFLPRLIEILPEKKEELIESDSHDGEEFIYVLEGVLTLTFGTQEHDLYPGDSAHFLSIEEHSWLNKTSKIVKFIVINSPNMLKKDIRVKRKPDKSEV